MLDNCEHLIEAVDDLVVSLLGRCLQLRVLATSRQPLGVDGKTVWPVPPLSLPAAHAADELAAVHESEAGRLFVDHAKRRRRGFALTAETAGDVASICRELEGLPLAIELAAARAGALSPEQIAGGLVLAATGDGDATLRAQVLWAAALLAILDQDFTQARAYAEEAFPLAQASGDQRTIGRWMTMAGQAQRSIDVNAAATIGGEAVEILRADGDRHRLALALANLALTEGMRDRFDAVRDTCEKFARLPGEKPPWLLPWIENALAWADISQGHPRSALAHCERALELEAGRTTLPHYVATAHRLQAMVLTGQARQAHEQGLALLVATGQAGLTLAAAALERSVASAELALGELDGAQRRAQRGCENPHRYTAAEWQDTMIQIALAEGDAKAVRRHAAQLRAVGTQADSARKVAFADWALGAAALLADEPGQAHALLHAALEAQAKEGPHPDATDTLKALGELALAGQDALRAARLLGAAQAARTQLGLMRLPPDEAGRRALHTRCEQLLGQERCEAAWAEGQALSLAEAIEYVRRSRGRRVRATRGWASLTRTEQQVAELAATGLSNPQIGARLFMSRGTVKTHLSRAYGKLGVNNRTQLAAIAREAPRGRTTGPA